MALLAVADGTSVISEKIFENRFMHVARTGAHGRADPHRRRHRHRARCGKAHRRAGDGDRYLRASVSLVLAGLAAEGETLVNRVYHLDRGFDRLEQKLSGVGADIARVPKNEDRASAATDAEDLEVLSARLQDAAGPLKNITWLPKKRRFGDGAEPPAMGSGRQDAGARYSACTLTAC